jgi:phosphonate transport system substrate-binding protein
MSRVLYRLLGLWFLLVGVLGAKAVLAAAPLVMAIHPYLAVGEIEKRFAPLARQLVLATGRDVVIRVPRDYEEHIGVVGRDEADIAFLGPASLLAVERKYGAKALLGRLETAGRAELYGHIVVRADSPLQKLADLRGKRMAFGDPQSTMSYLVPKAVLQAAGIAESDFAVASFVGNHDNIASAVLAGNFDAGAVKDETFDKFATRGLRSLAELPHVADHAFVATRRVPDELVVRLRVALQGLRDSESGRAILKGLQPNLTAIIPAQGRDYDSLRRLLYPSAKRSEARRP